MSQLSAPKDNGSRTNTKDKTKDKTKIKSKIKTKDMTKIKTKNNTQLFKALDSEMSPQINNLQSFDPFAEAGDVDLKQAKKIHVRAQQTQGRAKFGRDGKRKQHWVTTIEGLPEKFEKKKIVQHFKKTLACAGSVVKNETWGEVIQVQGDYRETVFQFLTGKTGLELSENVVVVHG
ncbi:hypothetical protein ACHAQE_009838 [Botrytis cinerea]